MRKSARLSLSMTIESTETMTELMDVNADPQSWALFNVSSDVDDLAERGLVAPFPPRDLMQRVSGLTDRHDFASHGKDIFLALSSASP